MTGYLLDTHVLLWWMQDPTLLSDDAQQQIRSDANAVFVSSAAAWEMSVKKSLGRLDCPTNLAEVLARDRIEVLRIDLPHALAVGDLPPLHRDPFDRMQIAQAQIEGLVLITRDRQIQQYDVRTLLA